VETPVDSSSIRPLKSNVRSGSRGASVLPSGADIVGLPRHACLVPILLQKSKIQQPRKSRECRFLAVSPLQRSWNRCGGCGRFCVKRCGPSRRRMNNAPAVLEKFVRQSNKDFFNTICHKQTSLRRQSPATSGCLRTYRHADPSPAGNIRDFVCRSSFRFPTIRNCLLTAPALRVRPGAP
jgi:hypothetical protein